MTFDYLYRDASNYKVFGSVCLTGTLTDSERNELVACLDSGEFFVAEQVSLPPLSPLLFEPGGGPSEADHVWHEFVGFRDDVRQAGSSQVWGTAADLLKAFKNASGNWRQELSPNFDG